MKATSAMLFGLLSDGASDAVSLHDAQGIALDVSARAADVLGDRSERLGTSPLWAIADATDAERVGAAFSATLHTGETHHITWHLSPRTSATRHTVHTRFSRVPGRVDGTHEILAISHSDRQHADPRSHFDEARALVERAAYGIYRSSVDGRFLVVNQTLVRMLRYETEDEVFALNIPTQVYADPSDREVLVRRAIEGRLGDWTHARWKTKDGSVITVRLAVNAIANKDGQVDTFEGIVEDVTESLRREEILRRNERMASLGTMLAGVAHELNNPLAAISGFAQIILRGQSLNEEDRGAIDTINHEANRAARIVRDLQTFARERSYLQKEEVDLNDVVSYVLSTHRYRLDTHGIQRDVTLAPALPRVQAERAHVEQVLINLIANATQALESITDAPAHGDGAAGAAARRQPTITVRTAVRDGHAVIEVNDNGPGISPDNLPRIFDPFFTTRREGEGTGLGLAVVHGIVHSYGGTLEAESELGRGTLFRVGFPAVAVESDDGAVDEEIDVSASRAEKRLEILVVEDETAIRRLLSRYFASRGHAVTTAEDGTAALREAQQSAFDVIVCDLRLPGIDGFEVLRRIREMPTGKKSRCVLMSGANAKTPTGPMRELLRLSAIVDKPFEIEQLRRAVEG